MARRRPGVPYLHPHGLVSAAVRRGALPPARALACVDCGGPARYYHHHRGYSAGAVLDVVPVCTRCHRDRAGDHAQHHPPLERVNVEVYPDEAELIRRAKAAAVLRDQTFRDWVIEAFRRHLEASGGN